MTNDNALMNGALWYAQTLGWKVFPTNGIREDGMCTCGDRHDDPKLIGKHPLKGSRGHLEATTDAATIQGWWTENPRYNIGVYAKDSGFFVVDVDPRNGGDDSYYRLEEELGGDIPYTLRQETGVYTVRGETKRGFHLFFKMPEGKNLQFRKDLEPKGFPGIDIKYPGYVLLYPSNHLTGVEYAWDDKLAPWNFQMAEPSDAMLEYLTKPAGRERAQIGSPGTRNRNAGAAGLWDFVANLDFEGEKFDLDKFQQEGINEGSRAVDIYRMTCSMANKYGTEEGDREVVIAAMQKFNAEKVRPPLPMDELMIHVERAIEFVHLNPPSDKAHSSALGKEIGVYMANTSAYTQNTSTPEDDKSPVQITTYRAPEPSADEDDWEPEIAPGMASVPMSLDIDSLSEDEGGVVGGRSQTDTGNGRRMVDAFGNTMRYTPGLGFFLWNNKYWNPDVEELGIRERAKKLSAIIGAEAVKMEDKDDKGAALKWAKDSKSNARQAAAVESSKSDPRIYVPVETWDSDPHLLGVGNGVVNLKTGKLFSGRADLFITRRTPVAYQEGFGSLPRFQEFLDFATYGDKEYQRWLQRAFGYTLTGLSTLDVMFLVYGPPGTGKNVLVEAFVKALGTKQYALPLPSEILGGGDGKSNQTDQYYWAEMRGRRMIWVDELPETERMKENAVKKLTGSDEITARSPGEKPFQFESQAKLWITTNHRPVITDDAMWRRIRPIPWDRQPITPDPTLKSFIHSPDGGLPAILAWAIEGAYQVLNSTEADPLGWCDRVTQAAEMYRKNEDRIGMFLEEEMETQPTAQITVKQMFRVYQTWSEDRSERGLSQIAFTRKLQDRGVQIQGSGARAIVLGYNTRAPYQYGNNGSTIDWNGMSNHFGQ